MNTSSETQIVTSTDIISSTPTVKRGPGRPRKNPVLDASGNVIPNPPKTPKANYTIEIEPGVSYTYRSGSVVQMDRVVGGTKWEEDGKKMALEGKRDEFETIMTTPGRVRHRQQLEKGFVLGLLEMAATKAP